MIPFQEYIEQIIKNAQKSDGHIKLETDGGNKTGDILRKITKRTLLSYDLVMKDDEGNYLLNKRGLAFKSFKAENRKRRLAQFPILRDIAVAIIGAALSLLVGYILWQLDSQSKRQEMEEMRGLIKSANHRLDSLTNLPIYQQQIVDSAKHRRPSF